MPQWPLTISQCPILGWSIKPLTNVVEFDPDAGFPRRRRRTTVHSYELSVSYKIKKVDLQTFWIFYEDTIVDGVLPFDWPNPHNNGVLNSVSILGQPEVSQLTNSMHILTLKVRSMA